MSVSLSDLSPRAREQVLAKFAIETAKKQKYHAEKVEVTLADGTPYTFASKKEHRRYMELRTMERGGLIQNLRVQVPYDLIPSQKLSNGETEKGIKYVADFVYTQNGKEVVEDVKGYRNPSSVAYRVFTIKRKLMLWVHGIEITEV